MVTRTTTRHEAWLARLPANFTYAQAREAGLSKHALYALRDLSLLEPLGRGLYSQADLQPADSDLVAAVLRAPQATLCLRSALARHGLSDDIPSRIDLALPAGTRPPALHLPISWHRFDATRFHIGREQLDLGGGLAIGLYSPERCLIDAFRLRRLEGPELGNAALKRWLARRGAQPAALLELAAEFPRTAAPLRRSLEVLL